MAIFYDYCGENHSLQNCPYNLDAYGYMEDQNWNQQQNFSWYDQNTQNFLYHNNFVAAADMSWQIQPSYEHSNPLEQTFPTFTTSFDRFLEEMQNLNKSMEARLVKMDERMINWGGSTSIMDNMPKGTEIPRQEVSEQCEENPSMPRQHARAGVTSYMWAGVATSSNATTTSQDAAKSDASANSTEFDAENDTITLMLKHEPINCSHPQFSRQPHGIKETTCPGSKHTFCLGSEEIVCHGNKELACPGSPEAAHPGSRQHRSSPPRQQTGNMPRQHRSSPGSPEVARPGSRQAACPGSPEAARPGSRQATCPGSTEAARPGNRQVACPGSAEAACPDSTDKICPGSPEVARPGNRQAACPDSPEAARPGSRQAACPGSAEAARPGSRQAACPGSEEPVCPGSTQKFCPGSTQKFYPSSTDAPCPDSTESICPGNKLTFCFSREQNGCFNGNCLSDKITDCLENEAQSMVIPPTICVAPKFLLMEMLKKSEDNDTWKLDDFKKDVPSIDFNRILAEDCHGNWVEQQLPQQRRLHQTMMEVKANKVIKWLDVITIFPNPIFMPSGTIARWSVYMNFKGKRNKDISTVAVQREVAEIPLAQVFLGRIVTRWRVRMDYKKYRKWLTFLDSRSAYKFVIRTTVNIDLPTQVHAAAYYMPMCMPKFLSQHITCPTSCHGILLAQVPAAAYYLPKFMPTVPATASPPEDRSCTAD
ncbi:hypothetical protein V6N13_057231 [Hibiscus sabdariffa]